jgi:hypothetical protein
LKERIDREVLRRVFAAIMRVLRSQHGYGKVVVEIKNHSVAFISVEESVKVEE